MKLKQSRASVLPPSRKETPLRDNLIKPSYQAGLPPKPVPHLNNGVSNGLSSNHVSSSRPQNKPSVPDIARRPIKYVFLFTFYGSIVV